ncbi:MULTISPECIES: PA0069 family radical SAM protein [Achromobacter]|uniref:PA0069 family radical SAM protein n=1 Tax=Achromobacter TaxID=222 RepID=UPI001CBC04EB|nr:PA0069 family radical SAM protein [Achromobacter mucicolens]MDH1524162.1 PA0069 family radical SAM protein [Achromobacter mucicolens]UAN02738.1 PA0069 family radical SAM protein [Achromobacter mucicolens]
MARTDHSFPAGSGSPAAAPAALRGRGAVTNVRHRFQRDDRVQVDDGWSASGLPADFIDSVPDNAPDASDAVRSPVIPILPDTRCAPPAPKTTVTAEEARKILSRNDSPDIPFDVAANPYRGCEHGCVYCYARPTHSYLGYSPGLDFETRLVAKANAVQALRAELSRPGYKPSPINIGSATDAYQPIERDWRLTRGMLELMLETRHPVTIVTKNALVARDLDLLAALAQQNLVVVYISITTLDAGMARTLEPRAAAPWRRLEAVRSLTDAGVPVGVLVAPVIPFINDESMEHILQEAKAAGAHYASYTVLRMPWEVKTLFEDWLNAHYPDRAQRVLHRIEDLRNGRRNDPNFGSRMRGTGIWADLLRQRFAVATRKLGLNRTRLSLDCSRFAPPVGPGASASLFDAASAAVFAAPAGPAAATPGDAGGADSDFPSPAGAKASSGVPFPGGLPAVSGAYGRGARQLRAMAAGQLSLFD